MAAINAYLTFDGNCREAMTFYKDCLGGELAITTVGQTPASSQLPEKYKDAVMHAALKNGSLALFASDMMGMEEIRRGNTVTMMLYCSSEDEIRTYFKKLSAGAKVTTELKTEFWGSLYADLTDKFGMRWMLNYDLPKA